MPHELFIFPSRVFIFRIANASTWGWRAYRRHEPRISLQWLGYSQKISVIIYLQICKYRRMRTTGSRPLRPSGNLFLLITRAELRRQGLTFLAFYILQRTIEEREFFGVWDSPGDWARRL